MSSNGRAIAEEEAGKGKGEGGQGRRRAMEAGSARTEVDEPIDRRRGTRSWSRAGWAYSAGQNA